MRKKYFGFNAHIHIAVPVMLVFVCFILSSFAQENTNLMAEVAFMKVKPANVDNYVELEQKIWKPIHQERIKQGKLAGWVLYQVMYTGSDDPYNYVAVNLYSDMKNLESPFDGIDLDKIHPGKDISKEMQNTLDMRDMVKRQLINRVNFAYPGGGQSAAPFKFIVVNYMRTNPELNFVQIENEWAKPIHEVLIENGEWAGWSVWSNVFPRGSALESNFVTVDYFSEFAKLGSTNYREAFEKAHPDKDWEDFTQKISNSRDMMRTELWKLIDAATVE